MAGNELRLGFGSVFVHSSGAQVSFGQCARRRNSTCTQRMRPFARILNDNQAERVFFQHVLFVCFLHVSDPETRGRFQERGGGVSLSLCFSFFGESGKGRGIGFLGVKALW